MKLIDADALKEVFEEKGSEAVCGVELCKAIISQIDNQPTVEAEPVTRCKDCQYWMKNPYRESSVFGLCFKHKDIAIATDETDWCSWAERRTDETD